MSKVAITGHRPDKLTKPFLDYIPAIASALKTLGATYMYQGMADGADLLSAYAAMEARVPYEAVKPYSGHDTFTKDPKWMAAYKDALMQADKVSTLHESNTYPGPWVFHNRNRYMVDNADTVLAIWNGDEKGGTASTVKYAMTKNKKIWALDPDTLALKEFIYE